MNCLFCKEKARCHTKMEFNHDTVEKPFRVTGINQSYRIIEYFCGGCQTFLKTQFSDKDVRDVLEKIPKLFDCAINFDKGLLS